MVCPRIGGGGGGGEIGATPPGFDIFPTLGSQLTQVVAILYCRTQGTDVDVKIHTQVELHEVKFPWVAPPPPPPPSPIQGQTIDRCITLS